MKAIYPGCPCYFVGSKSMPPQQCVAIERSIGLTFSHALQGMMETPDNMWNTDMRGPLGFTWAAHESQLIPLDGDPDEVRQKEMEHV